LLLCPIRDPKGIQRESNGDLKGIQKGSKRGISKKTFEIQAKKDEIHAKKTFKIQIRMLNSKQRRI
jgi:hypothetical protein